MTWLTSGPLASFQATAILFLIVLIIASSGRAFLWAFKIRTVSLSGLEFFLFSSATGLGLLSFAILILGMVGKIDRISIILLLGLFAFFGAWNHFFLKQRGSLEILGKRQFCGDFERSAAFFWISAILFLSWLQALAPPIGQDALAYHLYHPKLFIENHRMYFIPLERESLWPYLTEVYFMVGLLLQGTTLAQLFHWIFYPLTAAAIYSYSLRFYGRRQGLMAVVFFFLCPMAFAQSGHCYVDLSLAFFTFLIFYGFALRGLLGEKSSAFLSGLAAGGAMAVKYLGLSSALIMTAFWIIRAKARWRVALVFLLSSALVCGLWYLRSWFLSGNPVYPFFAHIFGSGLDFDISEGAGYSKGILHFLRFGWDLTMHPRAFGGEVLGAQYLLFVPYLIFYIKKSKRVSREMALFTLVYVFFLFKQSQYARFYLSVVPFLSVGAAVALFSMLKDGKQWLKVSSIAILGTLLLLHTGIIFHRLKPMWPVILGAQTGAEYLEKRERSFKGFLYIKEHAKTGDKVLNSGDVRHFYSAFPETTNDTLFLRRELKLSGETIRDLLLREKFDYVWLQDDPVIKKYLHENDYAPVYSYDFTEGPKTWNLTVYESPHHRSRQIS